MAQEYYIDEYDKRAERVNSRSEIVRLCQQITSEYTAAERALHDFAEGTTRHDFINQRMENIGICNRQLRKLVSENEAAALVVQAMQGADEET